MKVDTELHYSMEDIMASMGADDKTSDIMILEAKDKFFIGGGCEAYSIVLDSPDDGGGEENKLQNVSICMASPMG